MKVKYLILLAILSLGMAACGDDEEEMNPTPVMCETEGVTYNNDIASIITTNCTTATCHNNDDLADGFSLESFQQTMAAALFDNFLPAINHEPGFAPMPRGAPMLPECDIDMITAWINAGFPE